MLAAGLPSARRSRDSDRRSIRRQSGCRLAASKSSRALLLRQLATSMHRLARRTHSAMTHERLRRSELDRRDTPAPDRLSAGSRSSAAVSVYVRFVGDRSVAAIELHLVDALGLRARVTIDGSLWRPQPRSWSLTSTSRRSFDSSIVDVTRCSRRIRAYPRRTPRAATLGSGLCATSQSPVCARATDRWLRNPCRC